jgi:adenosylcobinamide-GDP ribazoletransferase
VGAVTKTNTGAGGVRAALGLLTVLGRGSTPSPTALIWFAPVGAIVGLAVGGVHALGTIGDHPGRAALVVAALALVTGAALTGALHLDGLADSADGLMPHADRDRRLAIMAAPDVGAFGLVTVACVLLLSWSALATLSSGRQSTAAIAWGAVLARLAMAATLSLARPARPGGLSAAFQPTGSRIAGTVASLAAVGVLAVGLGALSGAPIADVVAVGGAMAAVGLVVTGAVIGLAAARLGGFTGDILGAIAVLVETTTWTAAALLL